MCRTYGTANHKSNAYSTVLSYCFGGCVRWSFFLSARQQVFIESWVAGDDSFHAFSARNSNVSGYVSIYFKCEAANCLQAAPMLPR
jgi:hypothetical protein